MLNKDQRQKYEDIYLSKPKLEFSLNPNLTVPNADFLSRKIAEIGDYVVFMHKVHHKIVDNVMPNHFSTFAVYNKNEYRKDNVPLNNHLNSFKPVYQLNKDHIVTFKTNTGMQIVQPTNQKRFNPDKSYFYFDFDSNNSQPEETPESFKNIEALSVIDRIIEKAGMYEDQQIIDLLYHEVEVLKNNIEYFEQQINNVRLTDDIQEQINKASRVPAIIFPIVYRKALSEIMTQNNIEKHLKEIEHFSNEEVLKTKKGNYKPNNKQIKELYISYMYDEKQKILDHLSINFANLEDLEYHYNKSLLNLYCFSEAVKKFEKNTTLEQEIEENQELNLGRK